MISALPCEVKRMKEKTKFFVEPRGFLAQTAVILMVLAAVLRLIGCWGAWDDKMYLYMQIVLPTAGAMLFAVLLFTLGKAAFWTTFLPVVLGAVAVGAESLGYETWLETALCMLLALLTAVVYTATAFGKIRTKWIGAALYALLIGYMFLFRDRELLSSLASASAQTVLKELALFSALLALLFTALSMHRRHPRPPLPPDLPSMKEPVVLPPDRNDAPPPPPAAEGPASSLETEKEASPSSPETGDKI